MEIRHPRKGDVLPVMLNLDGNYDPDWIWIYGNSILVCAPAHDAIHLIVLKKWGEMPPMWCHRLFQHVLKEVKARGFRRYIAWVSAEEEAESKLLEIAKFHGATFENFNGELIAGVL